jgi:hypothetical protein
MEARRQQALAWFFLIAYAWTSAFWAKGLVLCFEADGHVTLESVSSECTDCCSPSPEQGSPDDSREAPTIGACACVDVALSLGNFTPVKKSQAAEVQRAALAAYVPMRWPAPARASLRSSAGLPRSPASSTLPALNCVVLRV